LETLIELQKSGDSQLVIKQVTREYKCIDIKFLE